MRACASLLILALIGCLPGCATADQSGSAADANRLMDGILSIDALTLEDVLAKAKVGTAATMPPETAASR